MAEIWGKAGMEEGIVWREKALGKENKRGGGYCGETHKSARRCRQSRRARRCRGSERLRSGGLERAAETAAEVGTNLGGRRFSTPLIHQSL